MVGPRTVLFHCLVALLALRVTVAASGIYPTPPKCGYCLDAGFAPVCAYNGNLYLNMCVMDCLRLRVAPAYFCGHKSEGLGKMIRDGGKWHDDLGVVEAENVQRPQQLRTEEEMLIDETTEANGGRKCACPHLRRPVCDPFGNEYLNGCFARCKGVTSAFPCSSKMAVRKENTKTSAGGGVMEAESEIQQQQQLRTEEEMLIDETNDSEIPCGCEAVFEPVCDQYGTRYSNECLAECEGATDVYSCW